MVEVFFDHELFRCSGIGFTEMSEKLRKGFKALNQCVSR